MKLPPLISFLSPARVGGGGGVSTPLFPPVRAGPSKDQSLRAGQDCQTQNVRAGRGLGNLPKSRYFTKVRQLRSSGEGI